MRITFCHCAKVVLMIGRTYVVTATVAMLKKQQEKTVDMDAMRKDRDSGLPIAANFLLNDLYGNELIVRTGSTTR